MKHDESIIQASIVSALSLAGVYVFMVPMDIAGKMTMAKIMRLIAMGFRPGISDLCIMQDGTAKNHFMEVKQPGEKQNKNQVKFQALCERKHWPYAVVCSVEEAMEIVRKWGIV